MPRATRTMLRTAEIADARHIHGLITANLVEGHLLPRTLDELIVCVWDERQGAYFEIRPQRHVALDVYHHPYAYADLADVYEKENRHAA